MERAGFYRWSKEAAALDVPATISPQRNQSVAQSSSSQHESREARRDTTVPGLSLTVRKDAWKEAERYHLLTSPFPKLHAAHVEKGTFHSAQERQRWLGRPYT